MNNGQAPRIQILAGEHIDFLDDDASLAMFLRQVGPQIFDNVQYFQQRIDAGEKVNIIDWFGVLEIWRQQIAYVWMAHSPGRQRDGFQEKIKETWNEVRVAQKHIYEKCERELERRKAMS